MRLTGLIAIVFMLSACERSVYAGWSGEKTAERADIADVNARNALAKISELSDRVDKLENELSSTKRDLAMLRSENDGLRDTINKNADVFNKNKDYVLSVLRVMQDRLGL